MAAPEEIRWGLAPAPPEEIRWGLAVPPEEIRWGLAATAPEEIRWGLAMPPEEIRWSVATDIVPAGATIAQVCNAVGGGGALVLTLIDDYTESGTLALSARGSAGEIPVAVTSTTEARTIITALATDDDVYTLLVQDEAGTLLYYAPVAFTCAGQACFRRLNRAAVAAGGPPEPAWRDVLAGLVLAPAAAAAGDADSARAVLAQLAATCASATCGCGC